MDERPTIPDEREAEDRLARAAARLFTERFGPGSLPPFLPGEPHRLRAASVAAWDAAELHAQLEKLLGGPITSRADFRARVVPLLQRWRPGTGVRDGAGTLTITSPGCPFAARVELDPRVCEHCRFAQELLARRSARDAVEQVTFTRLARDGADACEMSIAWKED